MSEQRVTAKKYGAQRLLPADSTELEVANAIRHAEVVVLRVVPKVQHSVARRDDSVVVRVWGYATN